MIIVEFRIPMPFSAAEYQIGQLYTIAKKSRLESGIKIKTNSSPTTTTNHHPSRNGIVQINANEPYVNGYGGCGQYTNKTYYLGHKLPDWIKKLLPDSAAKLSEEAWNAYPYSKNKFTNPLLLDKLNLEIESRYLDGPPTMANVFNLDEKVSLSQRSIVVIDLVNAKYKQHNRTNNDTSSSSSVSPSTSHSNAQDILSFNPLFRAPLSRNWLQEYELAYDEQQTDAQQNICMFSSLASTGKMNGDDYGTNSSQESGELRRNLMTCYKLCRINFPVWPLQGKVEQFIQQYCRDTMIESHRQTWLWQDEWTGMSMDDIRRMERQTQSDLQELMQQTSFVQN